jgi:ABC-type sulfate/molybdate transport systems ATPase subunit
LIAEQLTGFITCLVGQLNSIIGTLWTYDMAVQPCGMSSGELDYRFPLQIQSAEHVAPDVAKGSKAQQQVVNFAFQLTVMLYMEMTDYPLYLDEPGEGFDEQHRTNLIGFVKQLMDANHHSQLFLVSHYAATHGSLVNSEVLVLDSNNITVPGEFNKHVVMR